MFKRFIQALSLSSVFIVLSMFQHLYVTGKTIYFHNLIVTQESLIYSIFCGIGITFLIFKMRKQ